MGVQQQHDTPTTSPGPAPPLQPHGAYYIVPTLREAQRQQRILEQSLGLSHLRPASPPSSPSKHQTVGEGVPHTLVAQMPPRHSLDGSGMSTWAKHEVGKVSGCEMDDVEWEAWGVSFGGRVGGR